MRDIFLQRIQRESSFHRFLEDDVIQILINSFGNDYKRLQYSKKIENPIEMALQFYQDYNVEYYSMLLQGINEKQIIVSYDLEKSFVNTESNIAFIKLTGNDNDLFLIVHEFAHFIDRNCIPKIIPDNYNFLCEVFSFYMEKQLELWLDDRKYSELISIRRNNRLYYEARMLQAIEYVLYYESLYKERGNIIAQDLDMNKVERIMNYDYDLNVGFVNYLVRYPLANVLSEYLKEIPVNKKDHDIWELCLNADLYKIVRKDYVKKY